MADNGFGAELWKSLRAVKFGKDGGIEVPVRANGRQGIVVGATAVAKSDAAHPRPASPNPGRFRTLWQRVAHR